MGVIFGKRTGSKNSVKAVAKVIDLLSGGYSLFEINRRLVDIPEVRTAINRIAETASMVPLYHVKETSVNGPIKKIEYVNSSIRGIFDVRANDFQTPQTFTTNIISRMLYNNNAFCVPDWDFTAGAIKAIYPIPATQFEIKKVEGINWIVFSELGTAFPYSDIIHLQRFPDINRGTRTQAIYTYTDVLESMQRAAIKQLESSGKIKALLVSQTNLKDEHLKAKLNEFKENFLTSENTTGIGMITGQYDVKPIELNYQDLDVKSKQELVKGIYNYFGTSENIINNSATELEYQQFINCLEALLKQMAQEFTYKLFSRKELKDGNRIIYDKLALDVATLQAKTLFLDKSVYQGAITRNEARARLGYGWIDGGDKLTANKNAAGMEEVSISEKA